MTETHNGDFNMNGITVRQATEADIPVIEGVLADTVGWCREAGRPMWGAEEVRWEALSKKYGIDGFYLAYRSGVPSGCMVIIDYDPFFWPNIEKGKSLFAHKLAVIKTARKTGAADALIGFFKKQGALRGVRAVRLDTHALRPRLRAFYERHGFVCVGEKTFNGERHTAFYEYEIKPDDKLDPVY